LNRSTGHEAELLGSRKQHGQQLAAVLAQSSHNGVIPVQISGLVLHHHAGSDDTCRDFSFDEHCASPHGIEMSDIGVPNHVFV
jgi:hypothetical protein